MKYDLSITTHNIKPHLDIERDIKEKKEGLFTFTLKVSQGNIEDYAQYRTVTVFEYRTLFTVERQPVIPCDHREGNTENAIRPGNR